MTTRPPRVLVAALTADLILFAAPAHAQLSLVDVSAAAGITNLSYGRGAAAADLDGDGLLDVVCANAGGENLFWRQRPDHTFTRANEAWGIDGPPQESMAALTADFDGDGDVDVVIANGGFTYHQPTKVLRNDLGGGGPLTDVTLSAGDAAIATISFGATALDADLDGDLDVYESSRHGDNRLLRNEGGLVFSDVTAAAGVDPVGTFHHCGSGDIDNDGWPEIGLGSPLGANVLFHNQQDGTFLDIAGPAGVQSPLYNFGLVFDDFDNDGWLDIYLPKYNAPQPGTHVLLNNRDLTFREIVEAVAPPPQSEMGHGTGDIDGDGYPDIFIGTGEPQNSVLDVLVRVTPDGAGDVSMSDLTDSSGLSAIGPTRCHGTVFMDYDQDGDVDLYLNHGGPSSQPSTLQADSLLQNQGTGRPWLGLDLRGIRSNRSAVNARLDVLTSTGRHVHRHVTVGQGFGNSDPLEQHVGLDVGESAVQVTVHWPGGVRQVHLGPTLEATTRLFESGLQLDGTPNQGQVVTLAASGPPGGALELLLGLDPLHQPVPKFNGYLEVLPLIPPLSLPLQADGTLDLDVVIPVDNTLEGVTLLAQAWIHEAGATSGGTLSNTLALTIR